MDLMRNFNALYTDEHAAQIGFSLSISKVHA